MLLPTGVNKARLTYLIQCLKLHILSQHVVYKAINAEYIKAERKCQQQRLRW